LFPAVAVPLVLLLGVALNDSSFNYSVEKYGILLLAVTIYPVR